MTNARSLLAGAAWTYGAQLVTMVVQFGYAAITSRLISATGFGAYGVALSVAALATLLANGGLAQAVGRSQLLEPARIRGLSLYALILGFTGALGLFVTADFWAFLWSVPESAGLIRWLSMNALVAPWTGLSGGLLRRQGRFKTLAKCVLSCNLIGMVLGAIAAYIWGSPLALLVSPIAAQSGMAIIGLALNLDIFKGRAKLSDAKNDINFSWKLTVASLLSYTNINIGKIATSSTLGAGALGQWNRADVVSTIPFMQVQTALIQTVYPEFRHDQYTGRRARTAWPDLLTLVAWASIPAAGVAAVVLPYLVPILFGPGWETAAWLAAPFAIFAGLQVVSTVLAAAIEALGRFRWIWASHLMLMLIYGISAILMLITHSWIAIISGLLTAQVAQHLLHVILCWRAGYISLRPLVRGYCEVLIVTISLATLMWLIVFSVQSLSVGLSIVVILLIVILVLAFLWRVRETLAPVKTARKYGILRS
ncbi:oligosaccharide flippase family protein [Arthrobacter sp. H5]|uniref:oligosaccharide flippase family protein n=1 Tax=Arthrobacter sp. H5 TaxID=1267973 RepID=UPI000488A43C|nr:oligosaccharide flippase family protein [Arthrobacter sp. H5]